MPWWSRETLFGCFQKIGVFTPPKWLVKVMENPIKMDGLGGPPLFSETSILTKNTKWFAEMSFPSQLVTCHIFVHPLSRQELENFSLEPSLKIYNSFIAACGRTKKWLHAVNVLATLRSLGGKVSLPGNTGSLWVWLESWCFRNLKNQVSLVGFFLLFTGFDR